MSDLSYKQALTEMNFQLIDETLDSYEIVVRDNTTVERAIASIEHEGRKAYVRQSLLPTRVRDTIVKAERAGLITAEQSEELGMYVSKVEQILLGRKSNEQ